MKCWQMQGIHIDLSRFGSACAEGSLRKSVRNECGSAGRLRVGELVSPPEQGQL